MQGELFGYSSKKCGSHNKNYIFKKTLRSLCCLECDKEFQTRSKHAKFCSENCGDKARWKRDKLKKIGEPLSCSTCGKEFFNHHRSLIRRFCSISCARKSHGKQNYEKLKNKLRSNPKFAAEYKKRQNEKRRNHYKAFGRKKHHERMACDSEYAALYRHRMKLRKAIYKERNPEQYRKSKQKSKRFSKYKLTEKTFHALIESQHFNCAVCEMSLELTPQVCIDHSHKNGKVRGVLCHHCNSLLGYAKDNEVVLLRAIRYLKRHSGAIELESKNSILPEANA